MRTKFNLTLSGLILIAAVLIASHGAVFAQPMSPSEQDGSHQRSLDSLKRVITLRVLSAAEKKEITACDRDKTQFLKQARAADPEYAKVDEAISQAKLKGTDPNETSVQSLLERKYAFEKKFDERFLSGKRGKQCGESESKRNAKIEAALNADKAYQALLKAGSQGPT